MTGAFADDKFIICDTVSCAFCCCRFSAKKNNAKRASTAYYSLCSTAAFGTRPVLSATNIAASGRIEVYVGYGRGGETFKSRATCSGTLVCRVVSCLLL